jgi:predicted RNA-binding Zn-ribbon protein involved in translation (DUF1610 family)
MTLADGLSGVVSGMDGNTGVINLSYRKILGGQQLIYKNPYCRKIKGSYTMLVRCGYCKTDIALYQKVGKGRLLRMYVERIIQSSVDLSGKPGTLFCPNCNQQLATRVTLKRKDTEAYVMVRGAYNTKLL